MQYVCVTGLASLRGFPIASLNLAWLWCKEKVRGTGLEVLGDLGSITSLDLSGCNRMTDGRLGFLQNLPLTALSLCSCKRVSDVGLGCLAGLSLTSLDISSCHRVSNAGLVHLMKMPLISLNVTSCPVSASAIAELMEANISLTVVKDYLVKDGRRVDLMF